MSGSDSGPRHEPEPGALTRAPDWLKVLESATAAAGDEFDLTTLAAGDWLRVSTGHTAYTFRIIDPGMRDAMLETDRPDRPSGRVRIMGCTFGLSSTIKPDHLFCGGNLEFTHQEGLWVHTTTAITRVAWFRANLPAPGSGDTLPEGGCDLKSPTSEES